MKNFILVFTLFAFSLNASEPNKLAFIDKEGFDELLSEVSNWGRWGDSDQLGTLNFDADTRTSSVIKFRVPS